MEVLRIKLSVLDVTNFLEANANSRCVYEGEAVLDAGHIIICGKVKCLEEDIIKLYGLCLQTSALHANPHEIKGVLDVDQEKATVQNMTCTYILVTLNELEEFSQTDIKCVWSKQKGMIADKYKAVHIGEMPCFQGKVDSDEEEDDIEMLNFLSTNVPNNAIKKHMEGLRKITTPNVNIDVKVTVSDKKKATHS